MSELTFLVQREVCNCLMPIHVDRCFIITTSLCQFELVARKRQPLCWQFEEFLLNLMCAVERLQMLGVKTFATGILFFLAMPLKLRLRLLYRCSKVCIERNLSKSARMSRMSYTFPPCSRAHTLRHCLCVHDVEAGTKH